MILRHQSAVFHHRCLVLHHQHAILCHQHAAFRPRHFHFTGVLFQRTRSLFEEKSDGWTHIGVTKQTSSLISHLILAGSFFRPEVARNPMIVLFLPPISHLFLAPIFFDHRKAGRLYILQNQVQHQPKLPSRLLTSSLVQFWQGAYLD